MPRNEEGEFELVLGNRQLLSVFFIVVVLLGVFFVMGYILGKNSSPAPGTDIAAVRKPSDTPSANPIIIDKSASVPEKPSAAEKPIVKSKPPPKVETKKQPEPKKAEPVATPVAADTRTGIPPKGSLFLQVAAVGRAEADVVAKVLRGKGYALWIAPSDKDNVFRVLVGPIQKSDQGKIRGELEGLGFKPFPRTF